MPLPPPPDAFLSPDFWEQVLESRPEGIFGSFVNQMTSRPQQRTFKDRFSDFYNQYLGQLTSQIQGGLDPTQGQLPTFGSFLQDKDFNKEFAALSPFERGFQASRYNAPSRFLPF